MSIDVMTQVWKYSRAYGSDLLIMLAIADHADDCGKAYPSVNTLAHKGRMSERNVQYCLRHLESLGELKVLKNAGPRGTHLFQISIEGANFAPVKTLHPKRKSRRNNDLSSQEGANISGVQSLRGERAFAGGVQPVAPESSVEPSVKETIEDTPPTPKPNVMDERFDTFWKAYPRKEAKGRALKVWKHLKPSAQFLEVVLGAISRQKASPQWTREHGKFIPHAATWLNDQRWEDENTEDLMPQTRQAISHDEVEL